ncbi:hypothetical protein ACTJIL_15100 [Luteimonas sp. 22616]|uniref:alpha-glutamyl/putrescinyl thymine pyrophosphorylase clade 3 protein n=1 Tax=Luteimonas sp. 22616 TaxID=3453951 RepID=UPI003F843828
MAEQFRGRINEFERTHGLLPGIEDFAGREALVEQMIESVRRIKFVTTVRARPLDARRTDPTSDIYDPVRAAIVFDKAGEVDEAAWQIFLSVHFGHSLTSKWRLPRDIYGRLGSGRLWGWREVSTGVLAFRMWLDANQATLKGGDGVVRRFGNHRKYTSLDAWKDNGTGDAVASYVEWVVAAGGHAALFNKAIAAAHGDPKETFGHLYDAMSVVKSFGRIARFDYLTMVGKTQIAHIEPDSAHLAGATGPLTGAKLLFGPGKRIADYDRLARAFGNAIGVNMQVVEDSICNWQKSPLKFIPFRG